MSSYRVVCCGLAPLNAFYQNDVDFGAYDEPARDVLIRALRALPYRYYMILNFDPRSRSYLLNVVWPNNAKLCSRAEGGATSAASAARSPSE